MCASKHWIRIIITDEQRGNERPQAIAAVQSGRPNGWTPTMLISVHNSHRRVSRCRRQMPRVTDPVEETNPNMNIAVPMIEANVDGEKEQWCESEEIWKFESSEFPGFE
jgi:hypothetical protein